MCQSHSSSPIPLVINKIPPSNQIYFHTPGRNCVRVYNFDYLSPVVLPFVFSATGRPSLDGFESECSKVRVRESEESRRSERETISLSIFSLRRI